MKAHIQSSISFFYRRLTLDGGSQELGEPSVIIFVVFNIKVIEHDEGLIFFFEMVSLVLACLH